MDEVISDKIYYSTKWGSQVCSDSLDVLGSLEPESVDLFITSPPFPLLRKKAYGNEEQDEYVRWLSQFAQLAKAALKPTGSLVLDIGGAYTRGAPVRSLHQFRALISFVDDLGYFLAEEFYWHNTSKLPSPIEWVNKRKIRAKDSVNTVWWLSKSEFPKADTSNVRTPYSPSMERLLRDPAKYYKPKSRPSEHKIGKSFSIDNGGALPSNLLSFSNSSSNDAYFRDIKALGMVGHPARFPEKLPEFFIKMLTDPGDLVVDFFSGSNTTGLMAERLERNWLSVEVDSAYAAASVLRFLPPDMDPQEKLAVIRSLVEGSRLFLGDAKDKVGG